MNLLTPGQCSAFLLNQTFVLVSWEWCPHYPSFYLNQAVRIIPFLIRQLITLSRVLILGPNSVDTLELDTSFDETYAMPSVSPGFLWLVSTVSDTSGPQLAPRIKFHELWFKARALLLAILQTAKLSTSKLIPYFSVIQLHLVPGFFSHLIVSLWILPITGQVRVFWTSRLALTQLPIPLYRHTTSYFSCPECSGWYYCLSSGLWRWSYYKFRSTWTTY